MSASNKRSRVDDLSHTCKECHDDLEPLYCQKCLDNPSQKLLDYSSYSSHEKLKEVELFVEVGSTNEIDLCLDKLKEVIKTSRTKRILNIKYEFTSNSYTIGYFGKFPIHIHFNYSRINDHLICFYHPTSQLVYYPMIESWLMKYFPSVQQTNVDNFIPHMANFCPVITTK